MGSIRRFWYHFSENIPDMLIFFSYLFFLAWLLTTFWGGGYLALYLMKALVPKIGISKFVIVLSALTAALASLFLIDLGKLSDRYRRWSRDGWFIFVQVAVLGFALAVANIWIALFKKEVLPFKYMSVWFVLFLAFAWLLDRKERRKKRKKFADVDALLKKRD